MECRVRINEARGKKALMKKALALVKKRYGRRQKSHTRLELKN